jgi:uncharacterized protein (DUF433 family)
MLTVARDVNTHWLNQIAVFEMLNKFSVFTGGYVQIIPEMGCLPALIGNDARPVFLYEIIETIDNLVDYAAIKEALPTLSYAQISGAIAFVRKVAQLNARGIDIDEIEDELDANDAQLMDALRIARNDMEIKRVLNQD